MTSLGTVQNDAKQGICCAHIHKVAIQAATDMKQLALHKDKNINLCDKSPLGDAM